MNHLPLTFRLRLPYSQSKGRSVSLCLESGVQGESGQEGRAGGCRGEEEGWLLFTSLPQSSMQIPVHLKSEDIDISSAVITLLNEIIHISIKIFTPKVLLFSFPSFQENYDIISPK